MRILTTISREDDEKIFLLVICVVENLVTFNLGIHPFTPRFRRDSLFRVLNSIKRRDHYKSLKIMVVGL